MRIVEADQSSPVRRVQRERIGQAVRTRRSCLDALDLELHPIPLFEVMDTSIEAQQELKLIFGHSIVHIISEHDITTVGKEIVKANLPR